MFCAEEYKQQAIILVWYFNINPVSLSPQCLDSALRANLPAQMAAALPGDGSAMETTTALMDRMRCRNLDSLDFQGKKYI